MSKKKEEVQAVEAPVIEEIHAEVPSPSKAAFKALIERYKEQNPVKYELKEEALKAKLASLK